MDESDNNTMTLKRLIDVKTLGEVLKKGYINREGIRLIDCTYMPTAKPDYKEFKEKHYGKFEALMARDSAHKKLYLASRIPESIFADMDVAMYPGRYQRFSLYEPEVFEQYVQLLGINKGEQLIFYGRGAFGGMLFASRMAMLFKAYGHDKFSLLDGGFDYWKSQGNKVDTSVNPVQFKRGDWKATDNMQINITFEELEKKDSEGKDMIDHPEKTNFLDARIRAQFDGREDTGLDPYKVEGSFVPGFKNVPAAELVGDDGLIKPPNAIKELLEAGGYDKSKPTITSCNTGMQASMLAFVMENVYPETNVRVFNGSMKEMEARDPKRISGGAGHLKA
uniref:Sulfurtransferase n=1 Tax=Steinernema glaseri TaxID=37863 RepID=A0A1I7YK07_9BILA